MMCQRYLGLFCLLVSYVVGCGAQAYRPKLAVLKTQDLSQVDFATYCQKQLTGPDREEARVSLRLLLGALKSSHCSEAAEHIKVLKSLDLHASELSDLRALAYARNLEELSLSYTQASDLKPLLELPKLQKLFADGLPLTNDDISLLAQLPSLRELSLVRAVATDLAPLRDKESLRVLRLGGRAVDLSSLEGATLQELLLYNMPGGVDLATLGRLPQLQSLTIEDTPLNDERLLELAKLTGLRELNLSGSQISTLGFVGGMSGLKKLYLSGTRVSDLKPLAGLKQLEVLALGRTQVEEVEVLSQLPALTHLYLYQTKVAKIEALGHLQSLRLLSLSQTRVRDIKVLSKLKNLETLILMNVYVPDKTALLALSKLKLLYVEDSGLDAELFKRLQRERPKLELFTHPDAQTAR